MARSITLRPLLGAAGAAFGELGAVFLRGDAVLLEVLAVEWAAWAMSQVDFERPHALSFSEHQLVQLRSWRLRSSSSWELKVSICSSSVPAMLVPVDFGQARQNIESTKAIVEAVHAHEAYAPLHPA